MATANAYADVVFVATTTDHDPRANIFDTSSIEAVIDQAMMVNMRVAAQHFPILVAEGADVR